VALPDTWAFDGLMVANNGRRTSNWFLNFMVLNTQTLEKVNLF
jgi:hypothetical protein